MLKFYLLLFRFEIQISSLCTTTATSCCMAYMSECERRTRACGHAHNTAYERAHITFLWVSLEFIIFCCCWCYCWFLFVSFTLISSNFWRLFVFAIACSPVLRLYEQNREKKSLDIYALPCKAQCWSSSSWLLLQTDQCHGPCNICVNYIRVVHYNWTVDTNELITFAFGDIFVRYEHLI